MTAAMVENDQTSEGRPWDYLLRTWRELDVPEGWRAEIDAEQIVLVPPPHAHHNGIAAEVQRRLTEICPKSWRSTGPSASTWPRSTSSACRIS